MANPQNEATFGRMADILIQPNVPSDSELGQLITPDWYNNDQMLEGILGHSLRGYEGFRELYNFWKPFSNVRITIEEILSDGDWVACHFRMGGRHTGSFMGTPATGKSIDFTATGLFRFRNGKIAENIVNIDALGILTQLGIMQSMAQRKAA